MSVCTDIRTIIDKSIEDFCTKVSIKTGNTKNKWDIYSIYKWGEKSEDCNILDEDGKLVIYNNSQKIGIVNKQTWKVEIE